MEGAGLVLDALGRVRDMVREELQKRNYIERFETAEDHQGGEGVTVAYFKHD